MTQTLKISPLTRVEGHLDIELDITKPGTQFQVVRARSSGTMFRGFENILKGRDPRDAAQVTQRICGVCPQDHAMASVLALEDAFNFTAPDNGRILRNLVLGANFLQSHILHFYHLSAPDYIDTTGLLDMSPWKPRIVTADMATGATAAALVGHYVQALAIRRKAHQLATLLGGKAPHATTMVPGGNTQNATAANIPAAKALLAEISTFINTVYLPDVLAVAKLFPQYGSIGRGPGNLLAYGVFDLGGTSSDDDQVSTGAKLFKRGRYTNGAYASVDVTQIKEYVKYSYYQAADTGKNPAAGLTDTQLGKAGAYSWVKAPRYADRVHEVGPLARMWINGDYRKGISALDRIAARAYEAQKIAAAMTTWIGQLSTSRSAYTYKAIPATGTGIGLTEAARGALGHWMQVTGKKIARYQVITPTAWNASPMDDRGQGGAIEQALTGLRIADPAKPVEVLRVVHSFDPCLACAVHMVEADRPSKEFRIQI